MSPGVSLPAAVAAVGIDSGIAWHYGDPMREQRILETAAGVIDRSNRPVLVISGPDRLSLAAFHLLAARQQLG